MFDSCDSLLAFAEGVDKPRDRRGIQCWRGIGSPAGKWRTTLLTWDDYCRSECIRAESKWETPVERRGDGRTRRRRDMELTVSHEPGCVVASTMDSIDDSAGDLFREYLHPLVGIDLDYGAAVCAITIEAVARAANSKDVPL